jgi:mRNA-degrading endonuclease toxin of MazEF toxin-antitoxin module
VRVAPGESGLEQESEILPYRIMTIPAHRVGDVIGRIARHELRELTGVLRDWLDLFEV